jgi:hypothetical protein
MNPGRLLILLGGLLLIFGALLPWISVPNLFGLVGPADEGIEVGWEGDGAITGGIGLLLAVGEASFSWAPCSRVSRG